MSASLFPPACSPLAGDGSAGCRRWRRGRKPGQDCPSAGCPVPGLLALPCGCPCPRAGRLPLCLWQWLAGRGGARPLLICTCVVGRGEALHLIILRIFLCCGCHYCGAGTLPAPWLWGRTPGRGFNEGWDPSKPLLPLGCGRDGENQPPQLAMLSCPAWSSSWSRNSPVPCERVQTATPLNAGSSLPAAQDVCAPLPWLRPHTQSPLPFSFFPQLSL